MRGTWNEVFQIVPYKCWVVVSCHCPNEWLSVPTSRMTKNNVDFTLVVCIDGTSVSELVKSFSRVGF